MNLFFSKIYFLIVITVILFVVNSESVPGNRRSGQQVIGRHVIEKKIANYIKNIMPAHIVKYDIEYKSLPDSLFVPKDDVLFKIEQSKRNKIKGYVVLKVYVYHNQKVIEKFRAIVRIATYENVLVAHRNVLKHQVVQEDDIRFNCVETTKMSKHLFHRKEQVADFRAKRFIAAGNLFTEDMLEPVPLINKGDVVTIIYENKNISITTLGEALEDGVKQEIIDVKNLNSRKRLKCEVIAEKLVQIRNNN